jgi:hypothetical protein
MAALLFAGSWLVGVRGVAALVHELPRLRWAIRAAEAASEPVGWLWLQAVIVVGVCIAAGVVLVVTLLALLLMVGSQVLVDELGLAVEHQSLPMPLSRRLGAGRLPWKRVAALERQGPFFVIRGGGESDPASLVEDPVLRFLLVEDLERLILLVMERSPNLRFKE